MVTQCGAIFSCARTSEIFGYQGFGNRSSRTSIGMEDLKRLHAPSRSSWQWCSTGLGSGGFTEGEPKDETQLRERSAQPGLVFDLPV